MGPGRRPPMANGGGSVVARGRTAIGAGQVERAAKTHRLQGQGHQACWAAKGIEVHQLKTLLALQAAGQERLGRQRRGAHPGSTQGLQVGLQQGKSVGIGIIGPYLASPRLQAVAQGADAAAGHPIQNPQRALTRQHAGQEHAQIPRWPRCGPKKAIAQAQIRSSFAIVISSDRDQETDRGECRIPA